SGSEMAGMAAAKSSPGEWREVNGFGIEVAEGRLKALEVFRANGDGEVDVPSELGGAVQDARLPSHEKRPDLPTAERRKDSVNRAQGHTFPPTRGSSPRAAAIRRTAPAD